MGELLRATEKHPGGDPKRKERLPGNAMLPGNEEPPTLEELGISKRESADAQRLAEMPMETFERVKIGEQHGVHRATVIRDGDNQKDLTIPPKGVERIDRPECLQHV